jgi:hypothetical protein
VGLQASGLRSKQQVLGGTAQAGVEVMVVGVYRRAAL